MKLLEIKKLELSYGDIQVIWGIDLFVEENEIAVVIGQNGAGKSTLLSSVANMLPVKSGEIIFKGENIANNSVADTVKQGIMLVPEGAGVFPNMSVTDNLLMGAYTVKSKEKRKEIFDTVLALFPRLKERTTQFAGTLSGGERQMLAIGRALMSDPDLILLDEPSLGLQPLFVKKMFEVILNLKEMGKTILLVEQNVNKSLEICDRGYVLENGKIVLSGLGKDLINNEHVKKAYMGF
jgi:branched-chain amino acid transport system ATP-binding protein